MIEIEKVTAFKVQGTVYATRDEANRAIAESALRALCVQGDETIRRLDATICQWLMENAKAVHAALTPLATDPGQAIVKERGTDPT